LKPRSLRKKGTATEEEIRKAQIEAALFIRDGLLRLGPTFVKLGQVISTRTDVLPKEYTDVLKTLQDDVPGFSGRKAKAIVTAELGKPCDDIFTDFSEFPIAAASLGQVHTAKYKGKKVAVKVQRGMDIVLSLLFHYSRVLSAKTLFFFFDKSNALFLAISSWPKESV
jgi:predicted unusual protein kinase regulating ubiquinone biosynthesis (AarF/ABC1/UbiB family)